MRWRRGGVSSDIEDRRGFGGGTGIRIGLGGAAVLLVLSLVTGQNFFAILGEGGGSVDQGPYDGAPARDYQPAPGEDELVQFVSFVLDDAQGTWNRLLTTVGRDYRRAKLVLFTDGTQSGCGFGQAAMGPFYCPLDEKVYIDLGFYRELKRRFGAPGDFAQAYVIAHEIGHHVQHVLGISDKVREIQQARPDQANALSVRLELQADCFAGVWGHSTAKRDILEADDVDEALAAAAAIGDDRIQESAGGRSNPETWTHGSSEQRVHWFRRGLQSGRIEDCDTFETAD
jgi:predicted metalloprotease